MGANVIRTRYDEGTESAEVATSEIESSVAGTTTLDRECNNTLKIRMHLTNLNNTAPSIGTIDG